MSEAQNDGAVDGGIRIFLGIVCVGVVVYQFAKAPLLPLYLLIPVIVLIPFFLKTGITRVCPLMKAMGLSTNG